MKLETIRPEKVKEKVCWLIGWFRDAVGPDIITKQMRLLVGWPEILKMQMRWLVGWLHLF